MKVSELIAKLQELPDLGVYIADDTEVQWSLGIIEVDEYQNIVILK